jgi:hypothetical protein
LQLPGIEVSDETVKLPPPNSAAYILRQPGVEVSDETVKLPPPNSAAYICVSPTGEYGENNKKREGNARPYEYDFVLTMAVGATIGRPSCRFCRYFRYRAAAMNVSEGASVRL